jgi:hypothetical protein
MSSLKQVKQKQPQTTFPISTCWFKDSFGMKVVLEAYGIATVAWRNAGG